MARSPRKAPAAAAAAAAKKKKQVHFAPHAEVRVVPLGGRNMDPGYLARMNRQAGLRLHRVKLQKRMMNLHFGSGSVNSAGSAGQYTNMMARKDLWRKAYEGKLWYRATKKDNRVKFTPAFASALDELMALRDMFSAPPRRPAWP